MELQIPHCICAEVAPADNLWKDQGGSREDIAHAMREKRSRDTGSGGVPEPYPYAGKHTAEVQCIRVYGIPEREKFADDIRQVCEHEVPIWESTVLVQRVLCEYGRTQ